MAGKEPISPAHVVARRTQIALFGAGPTATQRTGTAEQNGGSASVLPVPPQPLSVTLPIDVARCRPAARRDWPGSRRGLWFPSMMRGNASAAGGQILPDLTRAVRGMSTSIKMDLGEVVVVDIPRVVLW